MKFGKIPSIILILIAGKLSATVIVQKNGDVISGRILEEKPDRYIFQSPYGKLQIAKSNVSKLILDEKTIELKDVVYKDKKVKARLVAQENNTAVYLTEDGQTIRKEESKALPTSETNASPRQRFLVSAAGSYGLSTFQQVNTDPLGANGGTPPLDQSFRPSALGFQTSGHYTLSSYFGVGAALAYYTWSGKATLAPTAPQLAYDANTSNSSLQFAGSVVVSLFGNLGIKATHDLRAEFHAGPSFNAATMEIVFKNPPNGFPPTATASGRNRSGAVEAQVYYSYAVSETLRLRIGVGYYRAFYTNLYDSGLQGANPFPPQDKFKPDFDRILSADGQNPQILSIVLGAEFGF